VADLSCLRAEMAISAGSRDRTVRFWKIADETQLVFRAGGTSRVREVLEGGAADADDEVEDEESKGARKGKGKQKKYVEGSTDCVAMVDESTFLSAGDSGYVQSWATPTPSHSLAFAHCFLTALFHYGCLRRRRQCFRMLWRMASMIQRNPVKRRALWRDLVG
jgi:ribosomal RNA-processing protein 9